jgi:hypothetical protein
MHELSGVIVDTRRSVGKGVLSAIRYEYFVYSASSMAQ